MPRSEGLRASPVCRSAGCGKPACPVRREGEPYSALPTPIESRQISFAEALVAAEGGELRGRHTRWVFGRHVGMERSLFPFRRDLGASGHAGAANSVVP